MSTHSNIARFATTLAVGMILLAAATVAYARGGGGAGSSGGGTHSSFVTTTGTRGPVSGGNTQGPCKGATCNNRAPVGGIYAPPTRRGCGGGSVHGCGGGVGGGGG